MIVKLFIPSNSSLGYSQSHLNPSQAPIFTMFWREEWVLRVHLTAEKKRRGGPKSSKLFTSFSCPIRDINTSCILQFFIYSNYSSTQLEMQLSAEQEAYSLPAVPNVAHSSFPTFCSSMRQITKRRGPLWAQQKSTNQIWISQIPFCALREVRHFSDRPTMSIKNLNYTNDCNQSYTLETK